MMNQKQTNRSVFTLIGAVSIEKLLIDAIPVSKGLELHLLTKAAGHEAQEKHVREIALQRYHHGQNARPVHIT